MYVLFIFTYFTGLAASLQARVRATLKIKEEDDERHHHRRPDASQIHPTLGNNIQMVPSQFKTESKSKTKNSQKNVMYFINFIFKYIILDLKRTSPIIQHHPRPAKMLYTDCSDQMINSELLHVNRRNMAPLMSPEINSRATEERHLIRQHPRNDVDGMSDKIFSQFR